MVLAFCRRGSVIPLCLCLLVGRDMKEGISGLRNESSKTKRTEFFQRMTAASPLIIPFLSQKVYSTFLPNLSLFWHIHQGIEEIMADHVHHEMTRNLILVYLRVFLLIVIKDLVLALLSFMNKSKNLMDRTHPSLLLPCLLGAGYRFPQVELVYLSRPCLSHRFKRDEEDKRKKKE